MRQALKRKSRNAGSQIGAVQSYQSPTGGWNARDNLAAMKPNDAISLINWWVTPTYLESRDGYAEYADTLTGDIETLATYSAMDGTNKLFAFSDDGGWDISTSGAGSATGATVTNGRWQWVNFGDGSNNYLIMCNGVDEPLYYNGTTWVSVDGSSTPALTGITTTLLTSPMVYQGRLFFIEKNSLSFWFLPAGDAGGALTEFDLAAYARLGGYLVSMATWTFDGGNGVDDYLAFATSEGEVIVYVGTNPASADDWLLKGVYPFGTPLGNRCFTKFGGDLLYICQNGVLPLSVFLQSTTVDNKLPVTDKISNAFNEAQRDYGDLFGWEGCFFQNQNALIFNVPIQENEEQEQYVMNVITKAWTRFTDWNANCFVVYNGNLYFGGSGEVFQAWIGASDNGTNIEVFGKTAFSFFGSTTQEKRFNLFRPMLAVNGNLSFLTGLDIDFNESPILGTATYSVTSGAVWDTSEWDEAYWASSMQAQKVWTSPQQNVGYSAAGKIKIATNAVKIQWLAQDYYYETGGVL